MLYIFRRSSCVFLVLLFVLSSIMTSTLCWQTSQLSTNIVARRGGEPDKPDNPGDVTPTRRTVELVKLEKLSDGTLTEKPIAGTAFLLFKENGEQIGATYLTDENGKITVKLKTGNYYFEEVNPGIGYTYDTENGQQITQYPFSVSGSVEKVITVKAYNIRLEGSLLIRKTVERADGLDLTDEQKNTPFEFTVTFSDEGTYFYHIDNDREKKELKSGDSLNLTHGQTAVFENLPAGVLYNVTETPVEGYIVSANGHRGNIAEDGSVAEFVNKIVEDDEKGSLIVTKEVTGSTIDADKEFTFTAEIGDMVETFTLKHGESKTFSDLPIGTSYKVFETAPKEKEYIATVKEYTGFITDADQLTLPFVNVYDESPDGKKGSVSVTKKVTGKDVDPEKIFAFEIVFEGEGAPENQSFTLKAEETKQFENIPYGVSYTISETDDGGYKKAVETIKGTVAGDVTANVTFKNTKPEELPTKSKIAVTKKLSGEYLESEKETEFSFVLTVNNEQTEFSLKADETKEFDVPYGAVYEISEQDYFARGYVQNIINGAGTAQGDLIDVIVTNSHPGSYEEKVEIFGEKTWNMGIYTDVVLPEEITVRLKNGEILVEEKTITPDESGKWSYTFIAPKYNRDGSLATYSVEEVPIDGYTPSYNGYHIVNTYVGPIWVDLPMIRKVITGEGAPAEEFDFIFKGLNGAPMPEGSEGSVKKLKIIGAGEVGAGTVKFTKPGTYAYQINELTGGVQGWTYDKSTYTITFYVTENGGMLNAERTIEKNGEGSDMVVFTNLFEREKLPADIIVAGTKTWNHGANAEDRWPSSIIVKLLADGELIEQKQVTAQNGWNYSFTVPRFAPDGHEIVYTIDEVDVEYYSKSINGYHLHNTYMGKRGGSPKTGDNNILTIWFALMLISGIGIAIMILYSKYCKKSFDCNTNQKQK